MPSTLNPQPGTWEGFSVATSAAYHVTGKPFADVGATDSGTVEIYDAVTNLHLATINNPTPAASDIAAVDQALAAWSSNNLSAALNSLGFILDDNEQDDLSGEQGDDYLHFGIGDKLKN